MWNRVPQNPALRPIGCFDSLSGPSPWSYPICVVGVLQPALPINVFCSDGWSGPEGWGVWNDGDHSVVRWVATSRMDYVLQLEAFPFCAPGRRQSLSIKLNGHPLTVHQWDQCENWAGQVTLPADLVSLGWNRIAFDYAYAVRPVDVQGEQNPDQRLLAVGFTRLQVTGRR